MTNKMKVATEYMYVVVCGMTLCYTKCFCTPVFYLINSWYGGDYNIQLDIHSMQYCTDTLNAGILSELLLW